MGPRAGEAAARLGKPLLPWQQHVFDVALEIDTSTGFLAYSEIDLIAMRQQGKTEIMLPAMTHRCTGFTADLAAWVRTELGIDVPDPGPQQVLYTAQTQDKAREKWRDIHLERLKASAYYRPRRQFSYRLQRNTEAITWSATGSMWRPGATTGKTGGTGDTLDLGVIDEAWSRPDKRTELGMRPAMLTRPWKQLWIASMVPGLSRALPADWPYLSEKIRIGRARVEAGIRHTVCYMEFSAAEGLDPADPDTWYSCMPALGYTISERAVRADYDSMIESGAVGVADFNAEYLGWAPKGSTPTWVLLPADLWRVDRLDQASAIDGQPALAVEMSEHRDRAWIGAAGWRPDGDYHVEIVEPGYKVPADVRGVDWVERRLVDIAERQEALCVVIDPRRPAGSLIVPLENRGIKVITPSQPVVAGACGRFYDATGANAEAEDPTLLWHLGQRELDRALSQARPLATPGGGFVFVRRGESAELGPLYAVTLAMLGLDLSGTPGDYDLSQSVDTTRRCRCDRTIYPDDDGVWRHVDYSPACV